MLVESQEKYVGTDEPESMTPAYVRKLLDMLLYHPFKNGTAKSEIDALAILQSVLSKAATRFAQDDTYGLFDNPVEYMICFNTFCVDIAREEHGLSEADYHFMIDEHNLSSNERVQPFYEKLAQALRHQLEGEADGAAGGAQDTEEMERQASLDRKKSQ